MEKLTIPSAHGGPLEFPLEEEDITLGRDQANRIVIESKHVSAFHARLAQLPGGEGYEIHDLGSYNGTTVNGLSVDRRILKNGDTIQFGKLYAHYEKFHNGAGVNGAGNVAAAELKALEEKVAASRCELEGVEGALAHTRVENRELSEQAEGARSELEALEEKVAARRGELESSEEALAQKHAENQELTEETEGARSELEALEERVAAHRGELESAEEALAQTRTENEKLVEETQTARSNFDAIRAEAAARDPEIDSVHDSVERARAELETLGSELETGRSELATLEERAAARRTELEAAEKSLSLKRAESDEEVPTGQDPGAPLEKPVEAKSLEDELVRLGFELQPLKRKSDD